MNRQTRDVVLFVSGLTVAVAWPAAVMWLASKITLPGWLGKILLVAAVCLGFWVFVKLQEIGRELDHADYLEKKLK